MGFLMTLPHCGQSAHLHSAAAPQLCHFFPLVHIRDLGMYMTFWHSIKRFPQFPDVIPGRISS